MSASLCSRLTHSSDSCSRSRQYTPRHWSGAGAAWSAILVPRSSERAWWPSNYQAMCCSSSDPGADSAADDAPPSSLVHFVPRPPQPKDLYAVHSARARLGGPQTEAVLVHPTSQLSQDSSDLLEWCLADRNITLLADHLVGTHWMNRPEGREH